MDERNSKKWDKLVSLFGIVWVGIFWIGYWIILLVDSLDLIDIPTAYLPSIEMMIYVTIFLYLGFSIGRDWEKHWSRKSENSVPKNLENTDEDYSIILDYSSYWKTPIVIIVIITSFLFFTGYFGENWLTESVVGDFPGICLGVFTTLLFIRPLWPNWLKKLYEEEME